MRNVCDIVVVIIAVFGMVYLGFWFISLKPNPVEWHETGRSFYLLCSISLSFLGVLIRKC